MSRRYWEMKSILNKKPEKGREKHLVTRLVPLSVQTCRLHRNSLRRLCLDAVRCCPFGARSGKKHVVLARCYGGWGALLQLLNYKRHRSVTAGGRSPADAELAARAQTRDSVLPRWISFLAGLRLRRSPHEVFPIYNSVPQPNIDFGIWLLSNFHKTSNYYPNNYFKDVTRPSGPPRSWSWLCKEIIAVKIS